MEEHPNASLFRKAFAAMSEGDVSAAEAISDDIVWWQIGADEPIRGKAALLASMTGLGEAFEWEVDLHDVTASDDHVVALVEATVRGAGQEFSYRTAEIAHVVDGKITERWAFSDDTEAINRFFGQFAGD